MSEYIHVQGRRADPTRQADTGAWTAVRGNLFGEVVVEPRDPYFLADAGDYYYANDGTMGTVEAGGTETNDAPVSAVVYTKPFIFLRNTSTAAEGKRIYIDWIRLYMLVIGTSSSGAMGYTHQLDTGSTRITTAGRSITPVNVNMQSTNTASCTLYMGADGTTDMVAAAATSSSRIIGQGSFRSVTPVAYDTYLFRFGRTNPEISHIAQGSTGIAQVTIDEPPVVLGPTDQYLLHLGTGSQAAHHNIFVEMCFWQR